MNLSNGNSLNNNVGDYIIDPITNRGMKVPMCQSGNMHPSAYKYSQMNPVYNTHNRLAYDNCAYAQRLYESTSPLAYQINPVAYESCSKCQMVYPGYLGAMGGFGFGVGPNEINLESDLRNQTRINTLCPSHKYLPKCGCMERGMFCPQCQQGLPCGCEQCRYRNVNNVAPCRPGIIPVESIDSRQMKACNDLNGGLHINRFDYLCENPQDPARIFFYTNNARLGTNTNINERDSHDVNYKAVCTNIQQYSPYNCASGGQGCTYLDDFNKTIILNRR